MHLLKVLSKNRTLMLFNVLVYFTMLYFVYHSLHGERGLFSYGILRYDIAKKELELEKLNVERLALEHRVSMMRSSNLNLDMLDELARSHLGLIGEDEFVIMDPTGKFS